MKALLWEAIHQLFVHPLLFFTRNAGWVRRLHDHSREKAWPKKIDYKTGYTALIEKVKRSKKVKDTQGQEKEGSDVQ